MIRQLGMTAVAAASLLAYSTAAQAQECAELLVGAALSDTGKYSANGKNTRAGYEFAIETIKKAGGIKIGDKCYNFRIKYYDDEFDTGARCAVGRTPNQPGQDPVHAWAVQLRPHQGDRSRIREIQNSNGRGRRRVPLAVLAELQIPVCRTLDVRAVPQYGHCARRGEGRGLGEEGVRRQGRDDLRKRSILARRPCWRCRGHEEVRHEGRDRRQASPRSERHDGVPDEGESAEARSAPGVGA